MRYFDDEPTVDESIQETPLQNAPEDTEEGNEAEAEV